MEKCEHCGQVVNGLAENERLILQEHVRSKAMKASTETATISGWIAAASAGLIAVLAANLSDLLPILTQRAVFTALVALSISLLLAVRVRFISVRMSNLIDASDLARTPTGGDLTKLEPQLQYLKGLHPSYEVNERLADYRQAVTNSEAHTLFMRRTSVWQRYLMLIQASLAALSFIALVLFSLSTMGRTW